MAVKSTSLVTLEQVLAELSLVSDGGLRDMRLEGYIDRVSDLVEAECRRKFSRAVVLNEAHVGTPWPHMLLARPPINDATPAAIVITYQDSATAMSMDNVLIHDAEAGILYNREGWAGGAMRRNDIDGAQLAGTREKVWFVDYDGGFITAVQAIESGGAYEGLTPTLPGPVEQAVIDTVKLWYRTAKDTPGVVEEKIGDATERTTGAVDGGRSDKRSLPPSVRAMLAPYRLHDGG